MIKQLAHVCIGATNLEATEHFYTHILGLERGFNFMHSGRRIGFYIKLGQNTFIEVFEMGDTPNHDRNLIWHLCLEVEDIDAFIANVESRGGEVRDKKFGPDNAWQCWMTDPSGVAIEVMQYTENSTHFTGAGCILD